MVRYTTRLLKFGSKGEKTGWTYIEVPADLTEKLYPGNKRSFRVKGKLDRFSISHVALIPMGDGLFIMAINAAMRKGIAKKEGGMIKVQLERDQEEIPFSADFMECLADEPAAIRYFKTLAKGHQRYFSNWIESAKTENTKTKRISMAVNALARGLGYPEMMREERARKQS